MAAVKKNALDTVRALVEAGADVNRRDPLSHYTPLHQAASDGSIAIVKCLLGAGADRRITADELEAEVPGFEAFHPGLAVSTRGPTAHAICCERQRPAPSPPHEACARVLRLEPPVVGSVTVGAVDDRSVTLRWRRPAEHRRADADDLVEAYRVTGAQVGVQGHLANRVVVLSRRACEVQGEPTAYQITVNDLPSLQCLDCTVAARTAGLFGRESGRVLAFTAGRRPRPTGAPTLARVGRDSFQVEFTNVPLRGVDAFSRAEKKAKGGDFSRMAPNVEYECQLCALYPWRHGHDAAPADLARIHEESSDEDDDDDWEEWDCDEFGDEGEGELGDKKDPGYEYRKANWVLHCVSSSRLDPEHCTEGGVEPPLAKHDGVRARVRAFLRSWPIKDPPDPYKMPKLHVRARARNRYGWGPFSATTCVGRPRDPFVKVLDKTIDTVTIKWDALDRASAGYEVIYKRVDIRGGWSMHGSAHRQQSLHGITAAEVTANEFLDPRGAAGAAAGLLDDTLDMMRLDGGGEGDGTPAGKKAVSFAVAPGGGETKHGLARHQSGYFSVKTNHDGQRRRGANEWDDWTLVARDLMRRTFTIKKLAAGKHYDFRVRARPLLRPPHAWVRGASLRAPAATDPIRPEPPPVPTFPRCVDVDMASLISGVTMRGGLGKAPRRHDDAAAALAAKQKARAREDQRLGAAHISGVRLAADRSKIYDDEGGLLGKCECALPLPFETNGADVVEMRIEIASEPIRDPGFADIVDPKEDTTATFVRDVTMHERENVPLLLYPGRKYALRSQARNSAGWSDWGYPRSFETPPGLPPPPLVVMERKQRALRLRVDRPLLIDFRVFGRHEMIREGASRGFGAATPAKGSGERIEKLVAAEATGFYEVQYRDAAKARDAAELSSDAAAQLPWDCKQVESKHRKLRALLEHLTSGREYEIRCRAKYPHGWSRWSDRLYTTTTQ